MSDEQSTDAELETMETGLQPCITDSDEVSCEKCGAGHVKVMYHPMVLIHLGGEESPCAELLRRQILSGEVTEHLCVRCVRCGYGWATETADA